MGLFKNLQEIKACRRPGDFWTNFCHKLSVRFVSLIQDTRITPNQLTLASLFFTILAVCLISSRSYALRVYGIVILQIGYIFDCADGQLARYKKIFSPLIALFI